MQTTNSKSLKALIAELCPNGVEFKPLGEIAEIKRGTRVVKKQLSQIGKYEVYQNSMTPLGYYEKFNCAANTTFIISAGAAGEIGYSYKDFWAADDCLYIYCNENLNSRFLYFYLLCQQNFIYSNVRRASVPRLSMDIIRNLKIPIPPLEVEAEIVRILDTFTELIAELALQKKRYEYYRDLLLTFEDVEYKTLGEIAELYAGATPSTSKTEYWENGTISWMSSGEVNFGQIYKTEKKITQKGFDNCSAKMIPKNSVVVALAGQGKTRGTVAITRIELCTNQSLCSIVTNKKVNSYYLYFYMKGQYQNLRQISSGNGSRGGLNLKQLREFKIPVPPIEEQERIVAILDKFDKLCNDLSEGIPAEIALRKKQYEYYRDLLLTFEEKI